MDFYFCDDIGHWERVHFRAVHGHKNTLFCQHCITHALGLLGTKKIPAFGYKWSSLSLRHKQVKTSSVFKDLKGKQLRRAVAP